MSLFPPTSMTLLQKLAVEVTGGTLALKKFRIGKGLYVEVAVNWKEQCAADGSDARIEISFTVGEPLARISIY